MSPAGVLFVYQWLWVQLSVILWSSPFFCMWRWFSNWHFAPLVVCHYSSSCICYFVELLSNTWHTDKTFPSVIASKKCAIHVWFISFFFPLQIPCELPTCELWHLHDTPIFDLVRFTSYVSLDLIEAMWHRDRVLCDKRACQVIESSSFTSNLVLKI